MFFLSNYHYLQMQNFNFSEFIRRDPHHQRCYYCGEKYQRCMEHRDAFSLAFVRINLILIFYLLNLERHL